MRHGVDAVKGEETMPQFHEKAIPLAKKLSKFTKPKLMKLMSISKALAETNLDRYKTFSSDPAVESAETAFHAFNGDVYLGLDSQSLKATGLKFANKHVRILSGMYGYLRPGDKIQPYRLEMGSRLPVGRKKNLYAYWREDVAEAVNTDLEKIKSNVILNLASKEYFSVIDDSLIEATIITAHFREYRNGKLSAIQFNLKRARGLLTRYIIDHKISKVDQIKSFDTDGYSFATDLSDEANWFFTR